MGHERRTDSATAITEAKSPSSSSLLPMLIGGVVLTVLGMLAALTLS